MRLLAQAVAVAKYTDAIDYLKENPEKLPAVAQLFKMSPDILFSAHFIKEDEFMSYCED